jgi:hypothetical protein
LQNKGYSGNKIGAKATVAREECVIPNPFNHQAYKMEDSGNDDSLHLKEYRPDLHYEDPTYRRAWRLLADVAGDSCGDIGAL